MGSTQGTKRDGIKAVKAVIDAFENPGSHPAYHEEQKRRLEREWPSLYFAIQKVLALKNDQ